jgi:hypothetical protein
LEGKDLWWEKLTLDSESLIAPWARPRPFRPRPTLSEYQNALQQINLTSNEVTLLRTHAGSRNRSANMRDLARFALNSEQPCVANLAYGSLARKLCEAIPCWKPDTRDDGSWIWMSIVGEGWQPKNREFEWVLVPQLCELYGTQRK